MQPNDINNLNQLTPQNSLEDTGSVDDLAQAKMQARMVNQVRPERLKAELDHIDYLKEKLKKGYFAQSLDGMNEMEAGLRDLGMPGVYDTGRARSLVDLREEAIKESQNVRQQGQDWNRLSDREQDEIADRIKWGADYQKGWGVTFEAAKADGVGYKVNPTDAREEKAKKNLIFMVGNEIELELSRNPQTKQLAKDNNYVDNLAEKITTDKNFVALINQQAQTTRNIRLIRDDIERIMKENLANDLKGNL